MRTREKIDSAQLEIKDTVVSINRVTKVVKGGKNLSFSALVVVGDGHGVVGYGVGKAKEVPFLRTMSWKVPVSEHSMAVPASSESPCAAWESPAERSAPLTATG